MASRPPKDFAAFILTHKRPTVGQQLTMRALDNAGYTGPRFLVVDDEDPTIDEYKRVWGDERVIVFPKQATVDDFDIGDNFTGGASAIPRHAIWKLANEYGYRWFTMLDDDYTYFRWRFDHRLRPVHWGVTEETQQKQPRVLDLNRAYRAVLDWFKTTPEQLVAVAFGQGGDFVGGTGNIYLQTVRTKRKAMNTFILDTQRPFTFPGRLNEDVNAYTESQRRGLGFISTFQISIDQPQTQQAGGGLTDEYLASGTYVKAFTSVMRCPSAVQIAHLADRNSNPRIHHRVDYSKCAPAIVSAELRKNK